MLNKGRPMIETMAYSPGNVSTLTGLSKRQISEWRRTGVFVPAWGDGRQDLSPGPRHFYSFRDLVGLRVLARLKAMRLPLSERRRVQPWLLRHRETPWERLHVAVLENRRLCLADPGTTCDLAEATSCLELAPIVSGLRADVAQWLQRRPEDIGKVVRRRGVQGGAWIVAGTRIPTWSVMQMHEEGYDRQAIFRQYPELTEDDVRAAIAHEEALRRPGAA